MDKVIAEFVVRSALLSLCIAAGLYLLRVRAARVRHAVWTSVVALMIVLPAWMVWGPKAVLHVLVPAPATALVQPVMAERDLTVSLVSSPAVPQPVWTWQNSLLALYLLGAGFLLARLLTGTVRARMLVRRATSRAGQLTSDACVTPVTVGWLRPSIILPGNWKEWPAQQLGAVLAHEQEHVRRRDPLVQWLALLNRAVFWFHPLAWWLEKRLSGLAEEACDDAVLMSGQDPIEYSEYLLGLARVVRASGSRVSVVGMAMPGTFLPERIRRIAGGVEVQRISRGRMVSLIGVCAVVSIACTAVALGYSPVAPAVKAVAVSVAAPREPVILRSTEPALMAQARTVPAASRQSISGTIADPANLVVPGAQVTLTNVDTGAGMDQPTDNFGAYRFTDFPPGNYMLAVRLPGFRTLTKAGIHIGEGDAYNAGRMPLTIGSIIESLTVTGSKSSPVTTSAAQRASQAVTPGGLIEEPGVLICASCSGPARTGGNITGTALINELKPVYPTELQRQGIAGTVKMEMIISKEGRVMDVKVMASPDRDLERSAVDAVRQWRYRPTLLNGEPVEVLASLDVNFQLSN